jgi:hypothetical protein
VGFPIRSMLRSAILKSSSPARELAECAETVLDAPTNIRHLRPCDMIVFIRRSGFRLFCLGNSGRK